ncbi:hypothetical protein D3C84_1216690 [compost metagenome]
MFAIARSVPYVAEVGSISPPPLTIFSWAPERWSAAYVHPDRLSTANDVEFVFGKDDSKDAAIACARRMAAAWGTFYLENESIR